DERERIEKSIIEDIEKRIGKVNERRKDTIDDKKKAETLAQDAKLAHETQQAWKKTDETLGKVVDTDVKTETVLQDARKLAEEARVLWSRVRDTWEQALGSDTISAMSDLSLRTQWMNSPQKKSIDDIYDKRIKAISEKGNKAIQNLDSTHASEIADMNKYKKILSKKSIEKQYNKQRDALILKYDRQRDAVYKEQALALQQAQIEFEKKGDKLSPKLPDIPERGGLKESLAASRRPPTAQLYSKGGESSTSAARRPQEDLRKPISGPTPRRKSAYSQSRQKDSDSDDDSLYARPRKRSESTTMPTKPPVEQPFAQEGELNKHPAKEQPDASHQPISGPTPRRKYNVQPVDYANYSRSDDDDLYTPGPPLQHIERPTTSKSPPIEQRDKESRTTVRRQSDATKTETPDKQAP